MAAFCHMMYSILPFQQTVQRITDIIRGHSRVQMRPTGTLLGLLMPFPRQHFPPLCLNSM